MKHLLAFLGAAVCLLGLQYAPAQADSLDILDNLTQQGVQVTSLNDGELDKVRAKINYYFELSPNTETWKYQLELQSKITGRVEQTGYRYGTKVVSWYSRGNTYGYENFYENKPGKLPKELLKYNKLLNSMTVWDSTRVIFWPGRSTFFGNTGGLTDFREDPIYGTKAIRIGNYKTDMGKGTTKIIFKR